MATSGDVVPIIATFLTAGGTIIVALISRRDKPVRDIIRRTKIQGNGSLAEALGVLQKQLTDEQNRSDRLIRDAQQRHQEEIRYYVEQLKIARKEILDLRVEKNAEIEDLRQRLEEHEERLNSGHVGEGK